MWVLATGRVALNHRPPESDREVVLRTLSRPGTVVAWAGCAGIATHSTSVVATRDCTLYRLDPALLDITRTDDPSLTLALMRRLLWLVSSHLRDARALFISSRFEQEIVAIRNLLEQSCTQLSVGSPLHRLPHLLESAYTLRDAFECLEAMSTSDDSLERSLAHLCLDILGEVRREHELFEALRRVYHAVVTAPADMSPREVRKICSQGFREAFTLVRSVVKGEEHLPAEPGHIFIFNHLKNHEYNTLPNNFQLTLDSHFVSAVILDPKYGDGGVRVVRKSRGTEYGHQSYYDRLGHISVYTKESDELVETPEQRRARRGRVLRPGGGASQGGHQHHPEPGGDELLDRGLTRSVQARGVPAGGQRRPRAAHRADRRRPLRPAGPLHRVHRAHQAAVPRVVRARRSGRSRPDASVPRRLPARSTPATSRRRASWRGSIEG